MRINHVGKEMKILVSHLAKRYLILIFLISLAVNLSFIFYRGNFYSPMIWESGEIARNIVKGLGFSGTFFGLPLHETSFHAPFYPYFLAFFYFVFGDAPITFIAIQITQALASSLTVVIVYGIADRLVNKNVAMLSSFLTAVYPDFIYSVSVIHHLTFELLFLSLFFLFLLKSEKNEEKYDLKPLFICGAILGVLILTEPVMLFFIPFLVLWAFLKNRRTRWRSSLKVIICILLIASVVIMPWEIRNYQVHKGFVPIKSQSGYLFWCDNTPPAIYTGIPKNFGDVPQSIKQNLSSELEINRRLMNNALVYVKNNPNTFIRACISRMYYFWWFKIIPTLEYQTPVLRKVIYAPLLLLTMLGIVFSLKEWRKYLIFYFLFLSFTCGYSLYHVLPRYRVPIEPFMIIFASYALYVILTTIRSKISKLQII